MSELVKCAVSHLPAGHPNACGDCDPCIVHDRPKQLEALYVDWEHMYWNIKSLMNSAQAASYALKSYEYGNSSPELAQEVIVALEAALAKARGEQ
jgi:hypothetical protein